MKTQIEIDIPDGWEFVRYGSPNKGEHYLAHSGVAEAMWVNDRFLAIIVQRGWQWPDWLLCDWLAMDAGGYWYAYSDEPVQDERHWKGNWIQIDPEFFAIDLPPCHDWRQSKRRRPT